jgi:hypothetical protein
LIIVFSMTALDNGLGSSASSCANAHVFAPTVFVRGGRDAREVVRAAVDHDRVFAVDKGDGAFLRCDETEVMEIRLEIAMVVTAKASPAPHPELVLATGGTASGVSPACWQRHLQLWSLKSELRRVSPGLARV